MEANLPYLFAAYTVIIIALFGYVAFLYLKERQLRREIDSLREQTKKD